MRVMKKSFVKCAIVFATILLIILFLPLKLSANELKTEVPGNKYELDSYEYGNYNYADIEDFSKVSKDNSYGTFTIGGKISDTTTEDGIPVYEVKEGSLKFYYNYSDIVLKNESLDSWRLNYDKTKEVGGVQLNNSVGKGSLILQTSKDRVNWFDVMSEVDAFNKTPIRTEEFYETKEVELINGCYYRFIVAYEMCKRIEQNNVLFVNADKYSFVRHVELYEFYISKNIEDKYSNTLNQQYEIGSKMKTESFDDYSQEVNVGADDVHSGWDLGQFHISGFTAKTKDVDGSPIFLKNVGDEVVLRFNLKQDINKLDGKDNLSILADETGKDKYFEIKPMNFGRGALIIRKTDYENKKTDPIIYSNYLEANTSINADTLVQLFEEGDYEVALNYQIKDDGFLVDNFHRYKIFFKFSVRNGNCMVFPFDIKTGEELSESSVTENGFYLDLAKSRYLKTNVKREVLKDTGDSLVEDTRYNGPAKDGEQYTKEGIYTITVDNLYTGQTTVKKIYVGTNNILKAHLNTGFDISEINDLVSHGAIIDNTGVLNLENFEESENKEPQLPQENQNEKPQENSEQSPQIENTEVENDNQSNGMIGLFVVSVAILSVYCIYKFKIKSDNK